MLIFQQTIGATTHFTLLAPDGAILSRVETAGTGSTAQGASAALLLSNGNGYYAVLTVDGTVLHVDPSLARVMADPEYGVASASGGYILYTAHDIVAVEGYDPARFVEIDLESGTRRTVVAARGTTPLGPVKPPILVNLGVAGNPPVARLLVRHASIGPVVDQWAIVEINLKDKTLVSRLSLPKLPVDSFQASAFALSQDGTTVAFSETLLADSPPGAMFRTHVLDLASGHEVVIPNLYRMPYGDDHLRLSPDGLALVGFGADSWPAADGKSDARLVVFSTLDGHELTSIDAGNASYHKIEVIGWVGPHTVAYRVVTASTEPFAASGAEGAYLIDVISGERTQLLDGIGPLVAVLHA